MSDADLKQIRLRNSYRRELQAIMETISNAKADYIEPNVCEKANIIRRPLSLDKEPGCRPSFFDQYQGDLEDMSEPDYPPPLEYEPGLEVYQKAQHVHGFTELYFSHRWPVEAPGSYSTSYVPLIALEYSFLTLMQVGQNQMWRPL